MMTPKQQELLNRWRAAQPPSGQQMQEILHTLLNHCAIGKWSVAELERVQRMLADFSPRWEPYDGWYGGKDVTPEDLAEGKRLINKS